LAEPTLSSEELALAMGLDAERVQAALEQLVAEGFVVREGDRLGLASHV
jgi:DNA-binding GntR family transcriptional regulator